MAVDRITCTRCGRPPHVDIGPTAAGRVMCARHAHVICGAGDPVRYVYCREGAAAPASAPRAGDETWDGDLGDTAGEALPPRRLAGRYALHERLGAGGMGVVYRATDPSVGRDVAIKLLAPGALASRQAASRFRKEAQAAGRLGHPHVVRVLDFGQDGDALFLVMELVDGPSLADVIADAGALPPAEAARICAAVARGVAAAHAAGVLHRDIKPGNVLLQPDGTPMLADFGLAQEADSGRMTHTGQVLGTPAYMAPEQVSGRAALGPETDVYGVGAVLYEALTGAAPYPIDPPPGGRAAAGVEVLAAILHTDPLPVAERRPSVPRELGYVVARAMARSPADRYPSVAALADDLERWLRGEPVLTGPPSLMARLRRWGRGHPSVALVGAALLLGLAEWASQDIVGRWLERREQAALEAAAIGRLAALERHLEELRASGEAETAQQELRTFTHGEENRDTLARAMAWQHEGDRRAQAGDPAGAIDAHAQAFAAAKDDEQWLASAAALALDFEASADPVRLLRLTDALVARGAASTLPWLAEARARALLALRRVDDATPADGPLAEAWPLVRALTRGTPLPPSIHPLVAPDGASVWLDRRDPAAVSWGRLALPLTREGELSLPAASDALWPLDLGADGWWMLAYTWGDRTRRLIPLDGGPAWSWEGAPPVSARAADLDHDGRRELYVGVGPYERRLIRFDRQADGFSMTSPAPEVDAAGSDVQLVAAMDLDDDGSEELLVGAGAWRAFDLRVYRSTADGLSGAARARLGVVGAIAELPGHPGEPPTIAACVGPAPPGVTLTPPARPGVHLLQFAGDRLNTLAVLPVYDDGGTSGCSGLASGDLDHDGLVDLVAAVHRDGPKLALWRGTPDGFTDPVLIGEVRMLGVLDVDGAPGVEVVAGVEGGSWILGAGDVPLPPRPGLAERMAVVTHPPTGDPVLDAAVERAELLIGLGLVSTAASRLLELAFQAPDPVASALASRAAEALDGEREHEAAEAAWKVAARWPPAASAALLGRARSQAARGAYAEAMATLDAAAAAGAEVAEDRARWTSLIPSASLDLGGAGPWTDAVRVLDPGALRVDPVDGAWTLSLVSGTGGALEVPIEHHGGHIAVTLTGELSRAEWGSYASWSAGSASDREHHAGIELGGVGGAGRLSVFAGCQHPYLGVYARSPMPVAGPAAQALAFSVRLDLVGDETACRRVVGGQRERAVWPLGGALDAGRWVLRLGPGDEHIGPTVVLRGVHATAVGSALVFSGVPSTPLQEAHLALARGALLDALTRYRELPASEDRDRGLLVAALRIGEDATVLQSAERLARTSSGRLALIAAFRREGTALTRAFGVRAPAWLPPLFWEAWSAAASAHPADATVQAAVVGADFVGGTPMDAETDVQLRLARASAWLAVGRLSEAARELDAAEPRAQGAAADAVVWSRVDVALRRGDVVGAERLVRQLSARSAAPELVSDRWAELRATR
jgi:hypothetical protein